MWGVSFLDVVFDILKFDGFKEQTVLGKIKWLLIYIPCLLIVIFLIAQYLYVTSKQRFVNLKRKLSKKK